MSYSGNDRRAEAAELLLTWRDTAVVHAAATLLAASADEDSMAVLCGSLARESDPEVQEEILWVLGPLWKSGELDLPSLLRGVATRFRGQARDGAELAARWLDIDLSIGVRPTSRHVDDLVQVVSALLYAIDPGGIGSTAFAPEDEYDDIARMMVGALQHIDPESVVRFHYPDAEQALISAFQALNRLSQTRAPPSS